MKKEIIKLDEARFILSNGEIGKIKMEWDAPWNLERLNKRNEYRTIIGIGRYKGTKGEIYVCLSRGSEILYVKKSVWLKIAESLKLLKPLK